MNRRTLFLAAAATAVATPLAGTAQQGQTVRRIGLLGLVDPQITDAERREFWAPARKLGWIEGENLRIERRHAAGNTERLPSLAEELVRLRVDVIVTSGTAATLAAKNATSTIPIIMYSSGDPVRAGLVSSLARPGGNVTGFSMISPELALKRVELLHELLPRVRRVGELVNPADPMSHVGRAEYERLFTVLGMQPIFVEVAAPSELANAVAEVARQHGEALIVPPVALFYSNALTLMRTALAYRLPIIGADRSFLEAGAVVSYSEGSSAEDIADQRRRYLIMLDKILRGANPGDIPVEQPTRFELGVNLKSAETLGITVPQSILLRAVEVIR